MRDIRNINRIVIKLGTTAITNTNNTINERIIKQLADVIAELCKSGKHIAIVTCGAIGAGQTKLNLPYVPTEMKDKQAAAAVGQGLLMGMYEKYFAPHNIPVGQVLLTKYTIQRDDTLANATTTFNTLFGLGAIPVINENDPLITDEIKLGDNDILAAHVANMIQADLLIFLTSTDGLYDKDPRQADAQLIPEVFHITEEIKAGAGSAIPDTRRSGGMATKLSAAVIASRSKTKTVIMNSSDPAAILDVLSGARIGTYIDVSGIKQ